jgi:hypothetical protein
MHERARLRERSKPGFRDACVAPAERLRPASRSAPRTGAADARRYRRALERNVAAQSLPPRRRGRRKVIDKFRPRSLGGPKWLWPMAGCRCSFQREIVGARGRPGETCGLDLDSASAAALRSAAPSMRGDAEAARATAQPALDALHGAGLRDRYGALEAEILLPSAQALRTLGRRDEACAAVQRALRLRGASLGEMSPLVSEARQAAAGCSS